MKKLITALFCSMIGGTAVAQWSLATNVRGSEKEFSLIRQYYKLDLAKIQSQLKNAQETGVNAKPVEISLPTLSGKIERFAVYSFPVMVKELADQYQLGSYVGVGIDDPGKYVRFSVAPNSFQSSISNNGKYEFIDALPSDKTIYTVHPKSNNPEGKSFDCSTSENPISVSQLSQLKKDGQSFTNQPTDFAKSSDKKYRTMRLAIAATGEYTTYHGGTQALALAAINATITRVNFVFEKDFALHLNIQNFPNIIYTNSATDFYTPPAVTGDPSINYQLQQLLTSSAVGNGNYDIGHVFNAAGNNGSAGCIGCVCVDPTSTNQNLQAAYGKGSAFTQSVTPVGDTFDIDFVAHEMGHQLGARHTFAHTLETGSIAHVEPGSGSTIMGYAGITGGPNTDVQANSDPFFHRISITQVQNNLVLRTCDVETTITNNPPVITPLPTYNIPKGTAFVLTASATDPENDPITYMWEQVDNSSVVINRNNLGITTTGATFRSLVATTSPSRYFPKLSSVLAGVLDNANNQWESVSKVARTTNFAVTVRDNNTVPTEQQTQSAQQSIVVGNDGPFKVNTDYAYTNAPTTISWDVANTSAAPYSVSDVKIDYTTDSNGLVWNSIIPTTPNDGTEVFNFPSSLNGQNIKLRISAIGNVFYAVRSVIVTTLVACDGSAPSGTNVTNLTTSSATFNWSPVTGASSYVVRYKKITDAAWTTLASATNTLLINSLQDGTAYEVQVAAVCSGTTGSYTASTNFSTLAMTAYCPASSIDSQHGHIANVTVANINNTSAASFYTNNTTNAALQINLIKNSQYTMTVTKAWIDGGPYPGVLTGWMDYNRNGVFEDSERIMTITANNYSVNPSTATFTVPSTAVTGLPLRMRLVMLYTTSTGNVYLADPCINNQGSGETEDYNVVISDVLSTNDAIKPNNGIQIYPNPVSDILNVTKVSDKAAYKIYSAAGQLVGNGNISNGKINVSSLIKGTYVITIDDKGKDSFNSKFIKK